MKLISNVEPIIQMLNSPHFGQFLDFEEGGQISKESIEHFAIVHVDNPSLIQITDTTKRKSKKKAVEATTTEEETNDVDLVESSESEKLELIRKSRRISCASTSILADDGWFICPIYVGMTELRPVVYRKLPAKKGYKITILNSPLYNVGTEFNKENIQYWQLSSYNKLNKLFNGNGIHCCGVFVHKRDDRSTKLIRNAVNRLETTQRTRIKLGNILIDEVISLVGQEAYVANKENLAKADKAKSSITEYDTNDVKIIKYIEKAYKRLHEVAEKNDAKVPIRRRKTFDNIMAILNKQEEDEHMERATAWLVDVKSSPEKLQDWQESYKKNMLDDGYEEDEISVPEEPTIDDAIEETRQLKVSDYINSFTTYVNIQIYMNAIKSEKDAELIVNDLVHKSYLWEYIEGIKGCGEITAAYILANIDFRSTVHPSSVIRYLGLDNIADIPSREGTPVSAEQLPLIIKFLFHQYRKISMREEIGDEDDFGKLPPISEDTFYRYAMELVDDYSEFLAIGRVYNSDDALSYEEMVKSDAEFEALVQKVWEHADITEYENNRGEMIPTIKKHARSKKDCVITTFLDKDGNISTKKSLGYNTKLKARIIEIMFGSMMKAKNEYYYGQIYLGYRERLANRYRTRGLDPDIHKNHIHMQARRFAVQIFIEELWMWVRNRLGYPTNGGTYYEAKLKAAHGQGLELLSPLNK